MVNIENTRADTVAKPRQNRQRITKSRVYVSLLTLPFFALVLAFCYYPLFGWAYAFVAYRPGISFFSQRFVGLKYFQQLFMPGFQFTQSITDTLALSVLGLIVSPLPMVFALLLNEIKSRKLGRALQTFTSIPNFISWVLVYAVAFAFFSSTGAFNNLLMNFGIIKEPTNVLGNESFAWYFQTILGIWKNMGWSAILYIAALSSIDQELYEAAEIDGCGRFKKAIHISVPGLMSTFAVLLLLGISAMLSNGFEQYFVFGNAMVLNKLNVLDVYVYNLGIGGSQYSFAIAVGIFKSVVSVILLFSANGVMKKVTGRSII